VTTIETAMRYFRENYKENKTLIQACWPMITAASLFGLINRLFPGHSDVLQTIFIMALICGIVILARKVDCLQKMLSEARGETPHTIGTKRLTEYLILLNENVHNDSKSPEYNAGVDRAILSISQFLTKDQCEELFQSMEKVDGGKP